ncbi:hypothetical protein C0993_000016 [Termitomyces sp. T159_Od127]|nr:hypothetical protein C0993_000016 [Termitomyces sp. T159_Od127]
MDLCFSPSSSTDGSAYKLLELPHDLCQLVENAIDTSSPLWQVYIAIQSRLLTILFSLKIKGQSGEDAVLCTANKTFAVRSVVLSNSILVVTSPPDASSLDFADDAVVIRDQVTEILELTPAVPKLHTLSTLLRGKEFDGDHDDDDGYAETTDATKMTYDDALQTIQASDIELERGLRERHILVYNGELRPIAPAYLDHLLELFLTVLVALSLSHESASVEAMSSSLADDHQVPRPISTQIMSWFGEIEDGKWKMNVNALIKEVGLGILRHHQPISQDELIAQWKLLVGDTFTSKVNLELLSVRYDIHLFVTRIYY